MMREMMRGERDDVRGERDEERGMMRDDEWREG